MPSEVIVHAASSSAVPVPPHAAVNVKVDVDGVANNTPANSTAIKIEKIFFMIEKIFG